MYKVQPNGCWQWIGKTRSQGRYGYLISKGKTISAHRYFCEQAHGQPGPSSFCCHKCNNSLCVNPGHLYWGTAKTNYHDSIDKMTVLSRLQKGHLNGNCKLSEEEYTSRVALAKELRALGFSFGRIANRLGIKSKGHARQLALAEIPIC